MPLFGGEFEFIEKMAEIIGECRDDVMVGIGDDAAVFTLKQKKVVWAVDMMIENVHFKRCWMPPKLLGRKALAINLSDIAAMGGVPLYALVSFAPDEKVNEFFAQEMYLGLKEMAESYGVKIVGGDTVSSLEGIVIDVTVLGLADKPILRSGAKTGDLVAVTGFLGDSAAGLNWLLTWEKNKKSTNLDLNEVPQEYRKLVQAHLNPIPRVKEAKAISFLDIHAMMDISDGIASEINHIGKKSKCGAVIYADKLPLSSEMQKLASELKKDPLEWALFGGEDYELLICLPPSALEKCQNALLPYGTPLTVIGEITAAEKGILLQTKKGELTPLKPLGWRHF